MKTPSRPDTRVTFDPGEELRAELELMAKENGRPLAGEIRFLCQQAVAKWKQERASK